jgi:hypothetical protein
MDMTLVTPPPVHPAEEADDVELRTAPPTLFRGEWSTSIFVLMLALLVAGAIVGFGGTMVRSHQSGIDGAATAAALQQTCAEERQMIEMAFEAYYAAHATDVESFEVLVGTYLREMPTRWVFAAGHPSTVVGIGDCAGM